MIGTRRRWVARPRHSRGAEEHGLVAQSQVAFGIDKGLSGAIHLPDRVGRLAESADIRHVARSQIHTVLFRGDDPRRPIQAALLDQQRLRENIKALGDKAEAKPLVARYVAKAGEQETRLEQIATERRGAASERAALQAELDAAIRALALDRKLEGP